MSRLERRLRSSIELWWAPAFFFGLLASSLVFMHWSIELAPGATDQLSYATAFGIDIASRTERFIATVGVFSFVTLVVFWLLSFIEKHEPHVHAMRSIFFVLGSIGCIAWSRLLLHPLPLTVPPTVWLIAGCILYVYCIALWHYVKKSAVETSALQIQLWVSIVSTLAAGILLGSSLQFAQVDSGVSLLIAGTVAAVVGALCIPLFARQSNQGLVLIGSVAAWVLLLPIVAREFSLLLEVRFQTVLQPLAIQWVVLLCMVIALVVVWLLRDRLFRQWASPGLSELFLRRALLPGLIVSASAWAWYLPVAKESLEIFEQGNPGLLIQQWIDFGKLPFIQTFSAHSFSDALTGFFYTALFGFQNEQWAAYDFLVRVVELLIVYVVIGRVTQRWQMIAILVLCWSALDVLSPLFFAPALLLIPAIERYRTKTTLARATLIAASFPLLFLWKMDTGIAVILATLATLLFFLVVDTQWRKRVMVVVVMHAVGAGVFGLALLAAIVGGIKAQGIDITTRLQVLQHIFDSNQTFGLVKLAGTINSAVVIDYALIPLALLMIIGSIAVWYSAWVKTVQDRVFANAIIFLSFFSLALIPRGFVRYTLLSGSTRNVLSYSILALCLFLYWRYRRRESAMSKQFFGSHWLFFVTLFIMTVILPIRMSTLFDLYQRLPTTESITDMALSHVKADQRADFSQRTTEIDALGREATFGNTKRFLDSQLTGDQTFFDFSTSPMLYVYAHRRAPHYANHTMLYHDAFLQQQLIAELQAQDIPLVIFSRTEPNVYNLDLIPFQYRYALVTEYVYAHYTPYAVIDGRHVWRRNDWTPPHPEGLTDVQRAPISAPVNPVMSLGLIPVLAELPETTSTSLVRPIRLYEQPDRAAAQLVRSTDFVGMVLPVEYGSERASLLTIRATATGSARVPMIVRFTSQKMEQGAFMFDVIGDGQERTYHLRMSTHYQWWNNTPANNELFIQKAPSSQSQFEILPEVLPGTLVDVPDASTTVSVQAIELQ